MAVSGPPGRGSDHEGVTSFGSMSFLICIVGSRYFSRKNRGIYIYCPLKFTDLIVQRLLKALIAGSLPVLVDVVIDIALFD